MKPYWYDSGVCKNVHRFAIKNTLVLNLLRSEYYLTRTIIDCPKGMLFFLGRVGQGKGKINVCVRLRLNKTKGLGERGPLRNENQGLD
jgi:hypothetical protein